MKYGAIILLLSLLVGCNQGPREKDNVLIASLGENKLYKSEVDGLIGKEATSEDSLQILHNYTDQWIRKHILLEEAKKYVTENIDIDQLVDDYRQSLLIHNYEKQLVEERMDTVVNQREKNAFYELNKNNYKLRTPIVSLRYMEIQNDIPQLKEIKKAWIRQNMDDLSSFAEKYGFNHILNDEKWITFAALKELLPQDVFSDRNLKSNKSLDKEKDGFQYFVKVIEYRDKNEEAPLSYIEDKIEKVILFNRKNNLLSSIKEELYQRDMRQKKVKIYEQK